VGRAHVRPIAPVTRGGDRATRVRLGTGIVVAPMPPG